MSPTLVRKLNLPKIPISKKIFGKNKTYIGFILGILGGTFVGFLYDVFKIDASPLYREFIYGFVCGLSAMLGDLVKSFFKRRVKIKEGEVWYPFDEIDFIVSTFIILKVLNITYMSIEHLIIMVSLAMIFSPIFNLIGYLLGFKKVPY